MTSVMDRREFIGTLAGGIVVAPFAAEAQQAAKSARIGYLTGGSSNPHLTEAPKSGGRVAASLAFVPVVAPTGHDRTCRIQMRDFIAR